LYELQLQSQEQATSSPRTPESHRKLWQKSKITSLDIPHESFIGSILGGQFQLQGVRCQDDYLDIYSVTNPDGVSFEAQAYSLSGLSTKLLQARKRRMKRLHQSKNFVCEIEQAGKRFLIIDLKRSDAELKNLSRKVDPQVQVWTSKKEFPDLAAGGCRNFSSDSVSEVVSKFVNLEQYNIKKLQDTDLALSSRPPSRHSLNLLYSRSSYAEVASKGIENETSSKTPKGVKQRQRRQRKREGKIPQGSVALPDRLIGKRFSC
jgi:hypothetical protein